MIHIKELFPKLINRLNINKETLEFRVSLFIKNQFKDSEIFKKIDFPNIYLNGQNIILEVKDKGGAAELFLRKEELLRKINSELKTSFKDIKFTQGSTRN